MKAAVFFCLFIIISATGLPQAETTATLVSDAPPQIPLEPAVRGFELLASSVVGIRLSPRHMRTVTSLVHPYHQQLTVYAWEVLGLDGRPA